MLAKNLFCSTQLLNRTFCSDALMLLMMRSSLLLRSQMLGSSFRSINKVLIFMLELLVVRFQEVKSKESQLQEPLLSNQRSLSLMRPHQPLIRRMNKKCKLLLMPLDKN